MFLVFVPKESIPYAAMTEGFHVLCVDTAEDAERHIFGDDGYGGDWLPIAAVSGQGGWHLLPELNSQNWEDAEECPVSLEDAKEQYLAMLAAKSNHYAKYSEWRNGLREQALQFLQSNSYPYEGWECVGEASDGGNDFASYVEHLWVFASPSGERIKSGIDLTNPVSWAMAELGLDKATFGG